jgi:hypothetical protein
LVKGLQAKTTQSKGRWCYIVSGADHSQKSDAPKLFIFRPLVRSELEIAILRLVDKIMQYDGQAVSPAHRIEILEPPETTTTMIARSTFHPSFIYLFITSGM